MWKIEWITSTRNGAKGHVNEHLYFNPGWTINSSESLLLEMMEWSFSLQWEKSSGKKEDYMLPSCAYLYAVSLIFLDVT